MGTAKEFWPGFCEDKTPPAAECTGGSLASEVLMSLGLPCEGSAGGGLDNIDIKHMDAEQLIKLSLLQEGFSGGRFKEMIVNEHGTIKFQEIGAAGGSISDVYYTIQSTTYTETCKGVMVTGGKPFPKRKVAEFTSILGDAKIYNCDWMSENGLAEKFSQYATIVFKDPHLVTGATYKDGIDSLYETLSPWESIIGYARYIDWPGSDNSPETTVERADTSTIPILVSGDVNSSDYTANLGTLHKRKDKETAVGSADTTQWYKVATGGVEIPITEEFAYTTLRGSKISTLIGISAIYIVGKKVSQVMGIPASDPDALNVPGNAKIKISVDSHGDSVYKLKEGEHYAINYTSTPPTVMFADNSRAFDPATFGNTVSVIVDQDSIYFAGDTMLVSLLPTGGTEGYLVSQVVALVNLQTPCVKIYDPRPGKAIEIATGLTYELAALVMVEEPAPVGFNGGIIDMTSMEQDHDPTTQQSFVDTDYEKALDTMTGGGVAVTLSFLDSAGVAKASQTLLNHLNMGQGSVTTYICGPRANPTLGATAPDGGIINDITYSYSDSNSYMVSVTSGPRLLGDIGNLTTGATWKTTENVPASGRVIEDMGNHILYKVMLDGCGSAPMVAINAVPKVIRVGDYVNCSVYNNAIEQ